MKKLVLILAILVTPIATFSQSLFDKYEDLDEVTSVVVNQKMFNMLAQIDIQTDDPEADEFLAMVKSLKNLKVLSTGSENISSQIKTDVDKYLKNSQLEELMRIKDGDQTVKFYVKEGKDENHVKELLMFVTGLKEVTKDSNIEINLIYIYMCMKKIHSKFLFKLAISLISESKSFSIYLFILYVNIHVQETLISYKKST